MEEEQNEEILKREIDRLTAHNEALAADDQAKYLKLRTLRQSLSEWLVESYRSGLWPESSENMEEVFYKFSLAIPEKEDTFQYMVRGWVRYPEWMPSDELSDELQQVRSELYEVAYEQGNVTAAVSEVEAW